MALLDDARPPRHGAPRAPRAPPGAGLLAPRDGLLRGAARDVRGPRPLRARVDYDAAAVRVSAENAALNGVPDVSFALCDVTADPIPGAEVVVANILALG